jgi:F0F1-type ATP synthase assembly protein I
MESCGGGDFEVRAKKHEDRSASTMSDDDGQNWGHGFGMGLQVIAGGALGFFVGSWVDKRFHTGPWGMLIGILLGLAAGMYQLIREGMRMNKD